MSEGDRSVEVGTVDLGSLYDEPIEVGLCISNQGALSEIPIKRLSRVNVGNLVGAIHLRRSHGVGVRLRWMHADWGRGSSSMWTSIYLIFKLEHIDVILSSSLAKKLAFSLPKCCLF